MASNMPTVYAVSATLRVRRPGSTPRPWVDRASARDPSARPPTEADRVPGGGFYGGK